MKVMKVREVEREPKQYFESEPGVLKEVNSEADKRQMAAEIIVEKLQQFNVGSRQNLGRMNVRDVLIDLMQYVRGKKPRPLA